MIGIEDDTRRTPMAAGLVVFDLDGTLLRGLKSCEVVAQSLGRLARMQEFEQSVSREEIEMARREMAQWYASATHKELTHCLRSATLAPGAREGIELLRSRGITVAIASITWDFAVEWFAGLLAVHRYLATRLDEQGRIHHVWAEDKARWVRELVDTLGLDPARVAAVGDTTGDVPMLVAVRHRVFVGRELPEGLDGAKHIPGGDVVEIAQWILAEFERSA